MLAEFSLSSGLILLGVGALAGLLGGLLGVGGGIVMIPAMFVLLGRTYGENSFHVYKLAAISTSLVLSVPAVWRHARAGAIVRRMVPGIVALALVGVVGGVLLAGVFKDEQTANLRRLFGVFLELVVLLNVYQRYRSAHGQDCLVCACPMPGRWSVIGPIVGLPAGFIAGLLGVGGGVWAVPSQRMLLGLDVRNAIANSSTSIVFIAAGTSAALSLQLAQFAHTPSLPALPLVGWWLALWLAPGALIGGWFGASLVHKLPVGLLRLAFLGLLVVTGLKLIVG